jgi:hypothetical protein
VSPRACAALMLVAGLAMAACPFLPWYTVQVGTDHRSITGVEGSGELWLLPVLGGLVVVVGLALAAAPGPVTARWAGVVAIVAGLLAAGWALRNGIVVPVDVVVDEPPRVLVADLEVAAQPLAVVITIVAGLATALAGLLAVRGPA